MPAWLAPAVAGAASLISMGIAKGKDQRQLRQQEKLQELQIRGNEHMMDYQQQKEMEMWEATGYGGQKAQMKAAGINPALMYGMGGGGGVTTGSFTGGVSGAEAPKGSGREMEDSIGMGIQLALMNAQKENIEADTANKLGDAANKPKVGKNIEASTGNLTQGIETLKSIEALNKVEAIIKEQDAFVGEQTIPQRIEMAQQGMQKIIQEVNTLRNDNEVNAATKSSRIQQVQTEAAGALLKNILTNEQIEQVKAGITQGWVGLGQEQQKIEMQKVMNSANLDNKDQDQVIDVIKGLMGLGAAAILKK